MFDFIQVLLEKNSLIFSRYCKHNASKVHVSYKAVIQLNHPLIDNKIVDRKT